MFSHLSFDCVLLWLLLLTTFPRMLTTEEHGSASLEGSYVVEVGQNAYLPCSYMPATSEDLVPVCWGKGSCPAFQCHSMVLNTDGRNVNYRTSRRYQLKGNIHKGDVSLTIENVTLADSGIYCCRIQFSGPMNDEKSNLRLEVNPAKVTPAWTTRRDITAAFPRLLTTEGHDSETQSMETFHDRNHTQISTSANELQDSGATTRIRVFIGAGIVAGLTLVLIFGALTLKWYSHKKEKLQNSSLVTLANLPPLGLTNAVAEGMRSEENIYTIEENVYEMEDPSEYYCYASPGQQS
ncbi:hepatitis A virus cellular receptor 2 isoform X1 [Rousettus aegyptiacus]|uniref:hepatitis A virus cellular receptor 2 isoform X1 n=1 Tax=Rousettus aegyptiacus TaxID=9407 RepID=UPI00168D636C|nr:hepatitis A virus cellular receptor 2 isoform X1 [Rousettus aegyptiacus]